VTTEAGYSGSQLSAAELFLQDHGNIVVFKNIWFVPAPSGLTHNQLRQYLPYDSVLSAAGVPVAIARPGPRGGAMARTPNSTDIFFDLTGRRVPDAGGASTPLVPVPVKK
jgi:hypothetical protein